MSPLAVAVAAAWAAGEGTASSQLFDIVGVPTVAVGASIRCGGFHMRIGGDGAVIGLVKAATGRVHADQDHYMGKLWYQGMDAAFFKTYVNQYVAGASDIWPEFTAEVLFKPNLKATAISSNGTVVALHALHADEATGRVVVRLAFSAAAHDTRGAPSFAEIEHVCGGGGGRGGGGGGERTHRSAEAKEGVNPSISISSTVRWFNKVRGRWRLNRGIGGWRGGLEERV